MSSCSNKAVMDFIVTATVVGRLGLLLVQQLHSQHVLTTVPLVWFTESGAHAASMIMIDCFKVFLGLVQIHQWDERERLHSSSQSHIGL